ncbi:STAS domain-containing protein [Propionivibrio limicola]|uniref:STAS domain-containing protein n=1 Tax=Propionivibrio limicola TaxID=167645 RepID=UPI001290BCA1|nr:STAS domain-containing protein [Propionivibrio limicola]
MPEPKKAGGAEQTPLDLSDFVFSESAPEFQIEAEIDPVDAQAEEAAVLFSNAQDEAARMVLEAAVRDPSSGMGERLWLMLFDLHRLSGDRAAFDALGIGYASAFEQSPPVWREASVPPEKAAVGKRKAGVSSSSVFFSDPLCGDNDAAFAAIEKSLEKNPKLRLDLGKITHFDDAGCARLMALRQKARKSRGEIVLLGLDALREQIAAGIEVGRAEGKACWLLLLDIHQLQGRQDVFEDLAINYAVTFEESPPSWEPERVMASEAASTPGAAGTTVDAEATSDPTPVAVANDEGSTNGFALRGDIKGAKFTELAAYGQQADSILVDCSALTRMDFVSAATLLNVLTPFCSSGKRIVFKQPNYLVAELFGVLGLDAVATIVFGKN